MVKERRETSRIHNESDRNLNEIIALVVCVEDSEYTHTHLETKKTDDYDPTNRYQKGTYRYQMHWKQKTNEKKIE